MSVQARQVSRVSFAFGVFLPPPAVTTPPVATQVLLHLHSVGLIACRFIWAASCCGCAGSVTMAARRRPSHNGPCRVTVDAANVIAGGRGLMLTASRRWPGHSHQGHVTRHLDNSPEMMDPQRHPCDSGPAAMARPRPCGNVPGTLAPRRRPPGDGPVTTAPRQWPCVATTAPRQWPCVATTALWG